MNLLHDTVQNSWFFLYKKLLQKNVFNLISTGGRRNILSFWVDINLSKEMIQLSFKSVVYSVLNHMILNLIRIFQTSYFSVIF